jgi:hypothetical protein
LKLYGHGNKSLLFARLESINLFFSTSITAKGILVYCFDAIIDEDEKKNEN